MAEYRGCACPESDAARIAFGAGGSRRATKRGDGLPKLAAGAPDPKLAPVEGVGDNPRSCIAASLGEDLWHALLGIAPTTDRGLGEDDALRAARRRGMRRGLALRSRAEPSDCALDSARAAVPTLSVVPARDTLAERGKAGRGEVACEGLLVRGEIVHDERLLINTALEGVGERVGLPRGELPLFRIRIEPRHVGQKDALSSQGSRQRQ